MTAQPESPKTRRRWLRYSLRTRLVVMLPCATTLWLRLGRSGVARRRYRGTDRRKGRQTDRRRLQWEIWSLLYWAIKCRRSKKADLQASGECASALLMSCVPGPTNLRPRSTTRQTPTTPIGCGGGPEECVDWRRERRGRYCISSSNARFLYRLKHLSRCPTTNADRPPPCG